MFFTPFTSAFIFRTEVSTVHFLETDQCQYWPDYINPPTNLHQASSGLGPSTYHPLNDRLWHEHAYVRSKWAVDEEKGQKL